MCVCVCMEIRVCVYDCECMCVGMCVSVCGTSEDVLISSTQTGKWFCCLLKKVRKILS